MNTYIPSTYSLGKGRKGKELEVLRGYLDHGFLTSPSGSTFLQGTVVDQDSSNRAVIAASGAGVGFALQSVKDLSGLNGYRNLQNTDVDRGEMIGVQFGAGVVATMIHCGSGNPGDKAYWDGTTLRFSASPPAADKVLGVLLHQDGTDYSAAVSGTAGSTSTASTVKAIVMFNITLE